MVYKRVTEAQKAENKRIRKAATDKRKAERETIKLAAKAKKTNQKLAAQKKKIDNTSRILSSAANRKVIGFKPDSRMKKIAAKRKPRKQSQATINKRIATRKRNAELKKIALIPTMALTKAQEEKYNNLLMGMESAPKITLKSKVAYKKSPAEIKAERVANIAKARAVKKAKPKKRKITKAQEKELNNLLMGMESAPKITLKRKIAYKKSPAEIKAGRIANIAKARAAKEAKKELKKITDTI